jgi:hypothetical protein
MATAQRPPLSFIPQNPQDQAIIEKLAASRRTLEEALKARENQLFDPVLLAITQGLLAPTKTGSFGEAIGNVAAMAGPAQEAQSKRLVENAQMRMELAQMEAQEANQRQTQRMLQGLPSFFEGPSVAAPGAAPGAAPAAAGAAQPAGPLAPNPTTSTNPDEVYATLSRFLRSGNPELVKAAEKQLELIKTRQGAYKFDRGLLMDFSNPNQPKLIGDYRQEQTPTEIVIGGKAMSIPMTGLEIFEFKRAKEQGEPAAQAYFDRVLAGRRSGPQAMPFGGDRGMFSIRIPNPSNASQLMTLTGEGTPRQRAMIEQAEEKAFETGDFSEVTRLYTQITGQGQYGQRPAPAAQPARAPGAPAAAPKVPAERAEVPPPTQEQNALMDQLRQASTRMASAVQANDANAERQARTEINNLRQQLATSQGIPVGLAVDPELAGLPIAEQVKITTDRIKANDKEATEQMGLIRQIGAPQQVVASNRRLEEIRRLVREHPDAVGLLVRQGLMNALMAAANEGFSFGSYRASAPVTTFLEKVKLPEPKQDVARRVVMLLDEEFFNRAAAYKSVLGPQISNADSVMMKSPSARPQDSARVIAYWATHSLLTNRQIDDMYNAAREYPKNRSPNNFIGEDVRRIMDSYTPLFTRIQSDFTAGR